jgi:hypothetical protein
MAKTIYKAAAMTELRNHDVWRLLMPSEMMVRVHDGDGSIFACVSCLFSVTELPVSVREISYNKRDGRFMCVVLSIGKPLYLVTKTVEYGSPPLVCKNNPKYHVL